MNAQAVKDASVVDIPLVLGDIEDGERSDTLWVKGDKPANSLLASFSVKPFQAASLTSNVPGQPRAAMLVEIEAAINASRNIPIASSPCDAQARHRLGTSTTQRRLTLGLF